MVSEIRIKIRKKKKFLLAKNYIPTRYIHRYFFKYLIKGSQKGPMLRSPLSWFNVLLLLF